MAAEMLLRDMLAAQALLGLMQHWEKFDEDGCLGSRKDDVASLAQQAMLNGWLSEHPCGGPLANELAIDAYIIADAMMAAREVKEPCPDPQPDPKETDLDEMKHEVMIGGPLHGKCVVYQGIPLQYINIENGQYHRHDLGFAGKLFAPVYIWSELHVTEAVDLVLGAIKTPAKR